jgi:hypothetical protein
MSNLIASPRRWRNKAILIKSEATYGVDAIPTGAANWIEARNVTLTPMDNDKVARNIDLPYLGNSGDIIVSSWAKLTFDVALAGSGVAGTAPKWAPLILACGTAETIVATTSASYNLISSAFGSVCAYVNIDGVQHALLGGRGEVKGKFAAKGTPTLSFTFDFNYVAPVVGAAPAVTRTGWAIEEGVNSANTLAAIINGVPLPFSALDWSFGNKVARMDLPGPQREIVISDRAPQATLTVLAPDIVTFNPFALASSAAVVAFTNTHGSAAGKKVRTDMQVRVIDAAYDKVDDMLAYKLTLQPIPVAGNDEIALTNI